MYRELTDIEILDSIRTGDQSGINQVYKKYSTMIYQLILTNNGSQQDAEDIYHEALVTMISNIRTPGFALTAKLSSYLYSISRNLWLYKLRQRGNSKMVDTELPDHILHEDQVPEIEIFEEKHALIAKVFDSISPDCNQLLKSFYFDQKPLKDLAAEMGLTDGFIRIKKMRCMEALKKLVENHPDYKKILEL